MNIYEIKANLLSIFDEIEEAGGEISPELEEELKITQEHFTDKVKSYTDVIKTLNSDVANIKIEQKRLQELARSKEKLVNKLSSIIIDAIELFGDTKKSGVKYVDYGTGVVSIRKTKAVDVNNEVLTAIGAGLKDVLDWIAYNNELDAYDQIDKNDLISIIGQTVEKEDETILGQTVTEDEVDNCDIDVTFRLPIASITSPEHYAVIKEVVKHCTAYDIKPIMDKRKAKQQLEENGSAFPHLAKIITNKNIQIK